LIQLINQIAHVVYECRLRLLVIYFFLLNYVDLPLWIFLFTSFFYLRFRWSFLYILLRTCLSRRPNFLLRLPVFVWWLFRFIFRLWILNLPQRRFFIRWNKTCLAFTLMVTWKLIYTLINLKIFLDFLLKFLIINNILIVIFFFWIPTILKHLWRLWSVLVLKKCVSFSISLAFLNFQFVIKINICVY
jgi:hypothetical protein